MVVVFSSVIVLITNLFSFIFLNKVLKDNIEISWSIKDDFRILPVFQMIVEVQFFA